MGIKIPEDHDNRNWTHAFRNWIRNLNLDFQTSKLSLLNPLRRFKNMKQQSSYVGLIPSIMQSGDHEYTRGMSPRANRIMRSYFVEAAWQALRYHPVMQEYYRSHHGKDPKKILIKVARKLLYQTRAVIVSEIPFQEGMVK